MAEVQKLQEQQEQQEHKLPENSSVYEATLIKAWREDGYSDEQIAEFLDLI